MLSNGGKEIDALYSGYFASLDHMGAMADLLECCKDESQSEHQAVHDSQSDQTALQLGRRIRSIHMWRVDLADPNVKGRFTDLTFKLMAQLDSDEELESLGFNSYSLLTRVESLCACWTGADGFSLNRLSRLTRGPGGAPQPNFRGLHA